MHRRALRHVPRSRARSTIIVEKLTVKLDAQQLIDSRVRIPLLTKATYSNIEKPGFV
jgi:hypothetical protein